MVKYGVTFCGRHVAINVSCNEVKGKSKMLSFGTKNTQKNENRGFS